MIDFAYRPSPSHLDFHRSSAYERCLFGGVGSGKSWALCGEAITFGLEQPGSRIVIGRKEASTLGETTEQVFFELLPDELFKTGKPQRSNGHMKKFRIANGTEFLFFELKEWEKFKSLNIAGLFIDEADEISEDMFNGWRQRLRQREPTPEGRKYGAPDITKRMIVLATNPRGHNWIYNYFIDGTTKKENTEYFLSTSLDNAQLPVSYVESLLSRPLPWVKRYVMCQFDDFAGQVLPDLQYDTHVISEPREGFKGRGVWMGLDFGTDNPTAAVWAVVDATQPRLIITREYEEGDRPATQHMAEWKRIEKDLDPVTLRMADPMVSRRELTSNMSIGHVFARGGFVFQPGPRTHDERIPILQELVTNRQLVLSERCTKTYDALKNYQWQDMTPKAKELGLNRSEKPLKKNDHLVDATGYMGSRFLRPVVEKLRTPNYSFEEQQARRIHKKMQQRCYNKSSASTGAW